MPAPTNPYVSSTKATEDVTAILHPLVLLSISDHVTRHALRKNKGPVVGAILGQHNGHQISLEHTFDFSVEKADDGSVCLNSVWFNDRLEQMRTVHKDRNLDLVGWYTMFSRAGPTASIMQVHEQILKVGSTDSATSESAVLLAFHSDDLLQPSVGGKLPITLYETSVKQEQDEEDATKAPAAAEASQDQVMEDAAAETSPAVRFPFKLSEVAYTVDSGEAEMISVDFVARGAANASTTTGALGAGSRSGPGPAAGGSSSASATAPAGADAGAGSSTSPNSSRDRAVAIESSNRSKKRLVSAGPDDSIATAEKTRAPGPAASASTAGGTLSAAEEEMIATLTTRANAIRMLHARLQLLTKYVESLPADALSEDAEIAEHPEPTSTSTAVSLPILRSIQALVQRLPLVVPPAPEGVFEEERQRETNDVELLSMLLDDMMGGISSIQGLHKKFTAMESYRWYSARQEQNGINQLAISARESVETQLRKNAGAGYSTQGVL